VLKFCPLRVERKIMRQMRLRNRINDAIEKLARPWSSFKPLASWESLDEPGRVRSNGQMTNAPRSCSKDNRPNRRFSPNPMDHLRLSRHRL
jgi:hypothetical protein